jgi:hypothetical protein
MDNEQAHSQLMRLAEGVYHTEIEDIPVIVTIENNKPYAMVEVVNKSDVKKFKQLTGFWEVAPFSIGISEVIEKG